MLLAILVIDSSLLLSIKCKDGAHMYSRLQRDSRVFQFLARLEKAAVNICR